MTRDAEMPICLGGSIFLHCLIGMLAIVYLAWIYDEAERPDPRLSSAPPKPKELALVLPDMIIVEEKPAEEEEARRVIDASGNEAVEDAPENAVFESDRNTRAGSALPPAEDGEKGIPTIDGRPLPAFSLQAREHSDGQSNAGAVIPVIFEKQSASGGAPAEPESLENPEEVLDPQEAKEEEMTEPREDVPPGSVLAGVESFIEELASDDDSDMIADKSGEPSMEEEGFQKLIDIPEEELVVPEKREEKEESPPEGEESEMKESTEPVPPADDPFQMSNPDSRMEGSIKRRGEAAVDAAETPLGRYHRKVKEVIGREWHRAVDRQVDYSSSGYLFLDFYIRPDGTTEDVRTTELNHNVILQSFTLDVVIRAKLPPPPKEVLELRADRRVHMKYGFFVN